MIAKLREDGEMGIVPNFQFLFSQEASQPLPCILNLRNTRISVFPEGEEFLVMLYGFAFPAFLLINLAQHVEALGVDITVTESARCKRINPLKSKD